MTSPLLELFYQLRDEEGFSLSIEQYNCAKNYIVQKFSDHPNSNLITNPNLTNLKTKRICESLWVKSQEEKQKFNEAWEKMLQNDREVKLTTNRDNSIINQQDFAQPIDSKNNYENSTITISQFPQEPPLPPSPSSPLPSPQLTLKDPKIGTALEIRKRWNVLSKNNPDYYPIATAKLQESWEQLHPLPFESPRRQWDLKSTVIEAAKRGFFERVIYQKKQLYRRQIVIFIDRSDSMIPFVGFARLLLHCWQEAASYYFDNVISEEVLTSETGWDSQSLNRTLLNYTPESTSCLIFSDAGAARKRYVEERFSETENILRRLTRRFSRVAWLNPLPYQRWFGTTALDIADLSEDIPNFAMFGLEIKDFDRLIPWLKEEAIPTRHFQPDFSQQWEPYLSDDDFFSPEDRLKLFEQDYDANTCDLLKRSAFPLSLSPDLLYYLRHHQDKNKQPSWYAIADILLSGLVRRVDRELYEMSPDIRKILLEKLSKEQLKTLAHQLQTYIRAQIAENSLLPPNLQHQEWLSLAYLQPSQAVDQLKQALKQALDHNNRVRLVGLTTLLESLSSALEGYEPLLMVTEPLNAYSRGDLTALANALERDIDNEQDLQNGLIEQIQTISPFKFSQLEPLTLNIPTLQFVFTAETVFVDNTGKIIKKQPIKAYYYDEILEGETEENKDDNFANIRMIYIPAGQFFMGTPDEEIEQLSKKYDADYFNQEKLQHLVNVPSFYLSQTPITQAQWKVIASREDLKVEQDLQLEPSNFKGKNRPVEKVSWEEAVEFCQRLSKWTGKGYKLPSEAKWEYACRSVINSPSSVNNEELTLKQWNQQYHQPFHFGPTLTSKIANYRADKTFADEPTGQYRKKTIPVGQFSPNAFGLYDMHGNVWEWCEDDYHSSYDGAPNDGSAWIDENSTRTKILRGGGWIYNPHYCRSAFRNLSNRDNHENDVGFRVMCDAGKTQ
ncbi:formylglycine-generating enzyme family protein [Crocosphaera chwakensis]|uniref:Sulfatase-modifying factor enzyme-like domain-containing protein n=1 Tax=Crocosphaera chwakensis CCY0110 TaxID=391612 RepID=A3IVY3_9CHRO|nr:SUMF1/EgtB/PvdO family nonheme iron enzyme [Crocosphaera chwakensis]EAZ89369.1 hypothetical protein CY0110_30850 [Crocosphaera chwakensis CCY0110]